MSQFKAHIRIYTDASARCGMNGDVEPNIESDTKVSLNNMSSDIGYVYGYPEKITAFASKKGSVITSIALSKKSWAPILCDNVRASVRKYNPPLPPLWLLIHHHMVIHNLVNLWITVRNLSWKDLLLAPYWSTSPTTTDRLFFRALLFAHLHNTIYSVEV